MDEPQAVVIRDRVVGQWLGAEADLRAGIRAVISGEDLDQGGLARPVLADQGVDFPFFDIEVDVQQGRSPGKGLGQAPDFQDR